MRDALDRAAAELDGRFDKQPLVEAALRGTLGQTYLHLESFRKRRTPEAGTGTARGCTCRTRK
jgi:hypothetical protein